MRQAPYLNQVIANPIEANLPPLRTNALVRVPGCCGQQPTTLQLNRMDLTRGCLCGGATGTGKTFFMRKMASDFRHNADMPYAMVIVEAKNDYYQTLAKEGDLILGQAQFRDVSVRWNLFRDLLYDGWDDASIKANCNEFARQLFEAKNEKDRFFSEAAQTLFAWVLIYLIHQAAASLQTRQRLNNRTLVNYFARFNQDAYHALLQAEPEAQPLQMLLGETMDNMQALGVLAQTILGVLRTFTDIYGEEGDFSMRAFVREKKKQALFLKHDMAFAETQKQLFGLMLNVMLKEVLSQSNQAGNIVFVCDELTAVGKIALDNAVNIGRGKGFIALVGLQSVEQLHDLYGEHRGNAVLAGLRNKFFFAPNDLKTAAHIKATFGESAQTQIILSPGGNIVQRDMCPVVEDSVLFALQTGDCICAVAESKPFLFHVQQ